MSKAIPDCRERYQGVARGLIGRLFFVVHLRSYHKVDDSRRARSRQQPLRKENVLQGILLKLPENLHFFLGKAYKQEAKNNR